MKTQEIKRVTESQISRIKYLFDLTFPGREGQMHREYLIQTHSKDKTRSVEYMTFDDAESLIDGLIWLLGRSWDASKTESTKKQTQNSTDKPVTPAQIKKIHVLLQQQGLMDQKETMLQSISKGKATSTKDLTCYEAKQWIAFLMDDQAETQKKQNIVVYAIWRLAWNMGIIYGDTEADYEMNRAKLNMFCLQRGTVKKKLTEQNLIELRKTHRQFEAMYTKHKNKVSDNERISVK